MDIVARAKALILSPQAEWPRIAAEPVAAPMQPFTAYAMPVSAVPAVALLLGGLLFPGLSGERAGALGALAAYALGLAGVLVSAKLIEALAPRFGGVADPVAAMKLAAHAPTASWLAGVFALVPPLGFLALLGLYSLYLLWTGIPVLVRVPQERRLVFTLALVAAAIAINIALALLVTLIL
jgi:hypothetical protein